MNVLPYEIIMDYELKTMAKSQTQHVCQDCGFTSAKWYGKCPECQTWNSMVEEMIADAAPAGKKQRSYAKEKTKSISIADVIDDNMQRIQLPWDELNRVMGGGITQGSVTLVSGSPGIGKSTILLQLLGMLSKISKKPLLYVSGEESSHQIQTRARRLDVANPSIFLFSETNLNQVMEELDRLQPQVVIIDSIQTLYHPDLASIPGSVSQVREVSDRLVRYAKEKNMTFFIVGHVTKEGGIAGPMVLEHLVDTVLRFEGERNVHYRILRALKNRFGPTDEIGVFEMSNDGLSEVVNPSELFLRERPDSSTGTVIFPAMEGSRTLLLEVQALATQSAYGVPLRNSVGYDKNRLTMLLAVLEKRGGFSLANQDIYGNVVGGIRVQETAADLAILASVMSSYVGKVFPAQTVVFGEVGLSGEVRSVQHIESRLREASKLGFHRAITPPIQKLRNVPKDIETIQIKNIKDLTKIF
jgi:DNA repair protein RadA/Sms